MRFGQAPNGLDGLLICKPLCVNTQRFFYIVYNWNMNSWISNKIVLKDSEKHGRGYFAAVKILKDEVLIVQGGRILLESDLDDGKEYAKYAYYCFQVESDKYICPASLESKDVDGVFLVNHSCDPNCGFSGQISLVAMRDINPGEEITYDYAMTDYLEDGFVWESMECRCGSVCCRKVISGSDSTLVNLQKAYDGYFSSYITKKSNKK